MTGEVVRASHFNSNVRDNLRALIWAMDEALTGFEGTTSTSYTDLATKGPWIQGLQIDNDAAYATVILTAVITSNTAATAGEMSYDMTGPGGLSRLASDDYFLYHRAGNISDDFHGSAMSRQSITATGAYSFFCRYRAVGAATASFAYRRILVYGTSS